ncbi:MAG: ribosome-associated protein [Hydrogenophaga sp.]|jgi:ribosome-associated protein
MKEIEITKVPVELFKILKFEGLASSGGEAKMAIENGLVMVNGAVETQKRKKIVSGDVIEFNDEKFKISFSG